MNRKTHARTARAVLLALVLIFALALSAAAAVPKPGADFRVFDEAGVLTDATVAHIVAQNERLYAMTGAEVVVVAVETTGFTSISDYARDLFAEWGIGSAERNNGVLILISANKSDYWALQGAGISDLVSDAKLGLLLTEYMAPSVNAGDFDTGALKTFDATVAFLESVYNVSLADWDGSASFTTSARGGTPSEGGASSGARSLSDKVFGGIKILFIVLVVIAVVIAAIAITSQVLATREAKERERVIMEKRRERAMSRSQELAQVRTGDVPLPPARRRPSQAQPRQGQISSQGQPSSQGQFTQEQPSQAQPRQGQIPPQGQFTQGQPSQAQPRQGQAPSQGQFTQGQPPQGQPRQGQPSQGQPQPPRDGRSISRSIDIQLDGEAPSGSTDSRLK